MQAPQEIAGFFYAPGPEGNKGERKYYQEPITFYAATKTT